MVLAGMSANLCVESHMRELLEQGFEVVVVPDATAAARLPGYDAGVAPSRARRPDRQARRPGISGHRFTTGG